MRESAARRAPTPAPFGLESGARFELRVEFGTLRHEGVFGSRLLSASRGVPHTCIGHRRRRARPSTGRPRRLRHASPHPACAKPRGREPSPPAAASSGSGHAASRHAASRHAASRHAAS
eukprot:1018664-Prymnesium_polylepis.1